MIQGILLAGGAGRRFGGAKLMATLPGDSAPIGVRAARSLLEGKQAEALSPFSPARFQGA